MGSCAERTGFPPVLAKMSIEGESRPSIRARARATSMSAWLARGLAALGRGAIDLEQGFGFGPANRLVRDRRRREDAFAPRHVVGIQFAGEMHTALGGRAFAGDHAVAHNGQRMRGAITTGGLEDAEVVGGLKTRNRHSYTSQFLVLIQHVRAHVNEWLPVRNRDFSISKWLIAPTGCRVPALRPALG